MTRLVFDTNVVVSALLSRSSPPSILLRRALAGNVRMCVSDPIFAEYEEVIRRPKLRRSELEIQSALDSIRTAAIWISPTRRVAACSDPDDDIFLDCAEAACADYLVTGNRKDFPPAWPGLQIISPRECLRILDSHPAVQ